MIRLRYVPWLLVLLYVGVEHLSFGYMLWTSMDFPSFYWGAQVAFQGHTSPYTADAFVAIKAASSQHVFPYLYPPPSLLIFSPFALMSYKYARMTMLGVNELCLFGFLYVFLFKIMGFTLRGLASQVGTLVIALYVILSVGVARTIDHGQINIVVLLAVCLSWYAMKRRASDAAVAAPLVVAILLKTYPILLIPMLLMRRRFGAAVWTGGLLAAVTAVAWVVLPGQVWGDWLRNVVPTGGYGQIPFNLFNPAAWGNQSLNAFAARLFVGHEYKPQLWYSRQAWTVSAYAMCVPVLLVTMGALWWSSRRDLRTAALPAADRPAAGPVDAIDVEWSAALAMQFLIAPLSWYHHLVFVLPAVIVSLRVIAYLAGSRADEPGPQADRYRAAAATFWIPLVLLATAIIALKTHFEWMGHRGAWILLASRHMIAVVVIWAFLLWWIWRAPRLAQRPAAAGASEADADTDLGAPEARGARTPVGAST